MTCKSYSLCSARTVIHLFHSDDSWHIFIKRFANSVQHITGQELEVRATSENDSATFVELEMEALRTKVNELSDEVRNIF